MNAQNKVSSIPITSVTWSISVDSTSTYNGAAQSVTVVSVSPVGATYSTSTTSATNSGSVASTTITGVAPYTGSFTSPNLTITKSNITNFSSNYEFLPDGTFWIVYSISFKGVANTSFDGILINTGTGAATYPGETAIPVTISGTFDGLGNYTYTFPNQGVPLIVTNYPQEGQLTLTASSTNYQGSLTTSLGFAV